MSKPGAKPESIDYASPGLREQEPFRRYRSIGTFSLIIGVVSLVICIATIVSGVREKPPLDQDKARIVSHTIPFAVVLATLAALLVGGSWLLVRHDPRGIVGLWIYVAAQLVVGVAWVIVGVSDLADSPAGMIAYFGMIPGALAAAAAIMVATELMGSANRGRRE